MSVFFAAFSLLFVGCQNSSSDSRLEVSVFGNVPGARQLHVVATLDGRSAQSDGAQSGAVSVIEGLSPQVISSSDLVFPRTLSLKMPFFQRGPVTVRVTALSASGVELAQATGGPVDYAPGTYSKISVCFGPCPVDSAVDIDAAAIAADASVADGAPVTVDGSVTNPIDGSIVHRPLPDGSVVNPPDGSVVRPPVVDGGPPGTCVGQGCFICPQPGWCLMPQQVGPGPRGGHSAVWLGAEMYIWGGLDNSPSLLNEGLLWDAVLAQWYLALQINTPVRRTLQSAVWTGSEIIMWGGNTENGPLNTGARLNPVTGVWAPFNQSNPPIARSGHSAIWTGSELVIWGGVDSASRYLGDGARWNPTTGVWTPLSLANAPSIRTGHSGVWTGSEMIIWGGFSPLTGFSNDGYRWNPITGQWSVINQANAPLARSMHSGIWTGSEMIIWGGKGTAANYLTDGYRWSPSTGAWLPLTAGGPAAGRAAHSAVWTGNEMIIWGGMYGSGFANLTNTGWVWRP